MQNRFQNHIRSNFLELTKSPFIIAISGGVDSVVLAHLCHALQLEFALAHCNFKLRGEESDKDAAFVKQLATTLERPFFLKEFNTTEVSKTSKESTQITARALRYNWFQELITTTAYTHILTAHHLNDSLETFLINLSRSTGIKGLTGIPTHNGDIRRPLLIFDKEEIKAFAIQHNISWREDQSNETTKYLRNKIRHRIIPELMDLNPMFLQNFESSLEKLKDAEALTTEFTELVASQVITTTGDQKEIDIAGLLSFKNPKAILYQLLSDYGFSEWNDVVHLLEAQTGKRVESSTHWLVKDRNKLILSPIPSEAFQAVEIDENRSVLNFGTFQLKFSVVKELGDFHPRLAYLDKSKLKFPLRLRTVVDGDYFYPFGMQGKKKLNDFLKDEKISPHLKPDQLLLCNGNEDILWVLNLRTDERYKVKSSTNEILKIEILK